jgi:hypothetical protein
MEDTIYDISVDELVVKHRISVNRGRSGEHICGKTNLQRIKTYVEAQLLEKMTSKRFEFPITVQMGWMSERSSMNNVEVSDFITMDTMYLVTKEIVDELNSKSESKLKVRAAIQYLVIDQA